MYDNKLIINPRIFEDPFLTERSGPGRLPYRFTSYTAPAVVDTDPTFGIQLHHPRFLEFIGAPESAAAVNLQRDAGLMSSNLQILCQFVTSLERMSSEVLNLAMGQVVFPSSEVAALSPAPRAARAAHYMAAMGLWWARVDPGGPGPLPTSSCNACMNCRYCFPAGPGLSTT